MVVVVLSNAGEQVPVMPLSEVVGNGDKVVPAQTAATGLKVGITGVLTVIARVVVGAH